MSFGVPSEDETEHEMLFPFVVCKAKGGPYDDDSYAAGWHLGQLFSDLRHVHPAVAALYVRTANVPQVDLLAMHFGYRVEAVPWADHPEEWTHVTLRLSPGT